MSDSNNMQPSECERSADGSRGNKRHSRKETENVHSANDWEHVDLGDEGRKSKFLRLMGANKKEHHGRIIIGEKKSSFSRGRSNEDNERLNADLEDQYRHGLEMKMSGCARRHTGLGFSEPEPPTASETTSEAGTDVAESTDGDGDLGIPAATEEKSSVEKSSVEDKRIRETRKDNGSKSSDARKPAMVGFVQSSSR